MYKINIIAISLFFSVCVWSQDSLSIKNNFYKQQQNSLLLLSGWSATNLVASPVFCKNLYSPESQSDYFHQMNFNWNLINAGICGVSHLLVHRDSKKPWNLNDISSRKNKAEKSLTFNMGLDLLYVITGFVLNQTANESKGNLNINKGYGNSLMIQGGYLLLYDAIFLRRLKKIKVPPKFD